MVLALRPMCSTIVMTLVDTACAYKACVLNAGVNRPGLLENTTVEEYELVMDTNVKGQSPVSDVMTYMNMM